MPWRGFLRTMRGIISWSVCLGMLRAVMSGDYTAYSGVTVLRSVSQSPHF
jgi:hypothetical protein